MADTEFPQALPANAVLVHIGMHKTGTTAIQTLLATRAGELRERGIAYPGPRGDHHVQARALTQLPAGPGGVEAAAPPEVWDELAAQIAAERGRVVLSSEFFSGARDGKPAQLVSDLGRERVHVIVGVRQPVATAVSTWQQGLKEGRVSGIDQWAAHNLPRAGKAPRGPSYWQHWDLGAMVRRWADAAGAGRVTVVVVDGSDRNRLPATFEHLLALEPGFLSGQDAPVGNRGMSAPEAELVRRINRGLRGRLEWPDYRRIVRYGVIRAMVEERRPGADEARPILPAWAQEELHVAGKRAADEIAATGVRVVGDLGALSAETYLAPPRDAGPDHLPIDAAVQAVIGAVMSDPTGRAGLRRIEDVTSRELAQILLQRVRRRANDAARRKRG